MSRGGGFGSPRGYGQPTLLVGAQLQHVLELSQRYDGVNAAGAQALLNGLSADGGSLVSIGTNRWEAALKDGNWVRLAWEPSTNVLQVTITDKQPHPIDQVRWIKSNFEKILHEKIAPRLVTYGAVAVGITLYHSVGDRADAVKQMAIDWTALYQNLASEVGEIPYDMSQVDWSKRPPAVQKAREEEVAAWKAIDAAPAAQKAAATKRAQELTARRGQLYLESFDPKKVAWWKSYASPLIKEWTKFKSDQLGDRTVASDYIAFAERWQTNWDVYEDWKKKLDNLRAEAVKQGFSINVPAATELPTTVWADVEHVIEKGAEKVASGAGDVWTFLKYGAWAVLGLGAIVAISSVASNIKSGKDPGEKYMELIRQSRRPRAPRAPRAAALPASEQLALAAGEGG